VRALIEELTSGQNAMNVRNLLTLSRVRT